jgi:hypothetical protein
LENVTLLKGQSSPDWFIDSMKFLIVIFAKLNKLILKIIWKYKGPRIGSMQMNKYGGFIHTS